MQQIFEVKVFSRDVAHPEQFRPGADSTDGPLRMRSSELVAAMNEEHAAGIVRERLLDTNAVIAVEDHGVLFSPTLDVVETLGLQG